MSDRVKVELALVVTPEMREAHEKRKRPILIFEELHAREVGQYDLGEISERRYESQHLDPSAVPLIRDLNPRAVELIRAAERRSKK